MLHETLYLAMSVKCSIYESALGPQLFIRMPSVKVNIAFFY
jgi:hypothetical protein